MPQFDPSQPFEEVPAADAAKAPKFDPSQPYEQVGSVAATPKETPAAPAVEDKPADIKTLFSGLNGLQQRLKPEQAKAFSNLKMIAGDNPQQAVARMANQIYVSQQLPELEPDYIRSHWEQIAPAFMERRFPNATAMGSEEERYNTIAEHLKTTAFMGKPEWQNASGVHKYQSFLDEFKFNASEVAKDAQKPFAALPEAPKNLPNMPALGMYNPAVVGGVYNSVLKPFVEGIESPLGVATLAAGTTLKTASASYRAAKYALVGMEGGFAAMMAKTAANQTPQMRAVLADPKASMQDKVEAIGRVVLPGVMAITGAVGAAIEVKPDIIGKIKGTPEQVAENLHKEADAEPIPEKSNIIRDAANHVEELANPEHPPDLLAAQEAADQAAPATEHLAEPAEPVTSDQVDAMVEQNRQTEGDASPELPENRTEEKPPARQPVESPTPTQTEPIEPPPLPSSAELQETSLKNATAELERAGYGLGEATPADAREMAPRWQEAGETLKRDPEAGARLAARLKADPNIGLSDSQSALLLRHKVGLENALNEAVDIATDPESSPELRAEAQTQTKDLSQELTDFMDAVQRRGSEWGREGRWRQAMAKEDYSFANQERLLRAKKGGGELSDGERSTLTKTISELQAKNTELEERMQKTREEKGPEEGVKEAIKEISSPPAKARTFKRAGAVGDRLSASASAARERIIARIKSGQVAAGIDPAVIGDYATIVADYIYRLGLNSVEVSAKMVAEFGDKIKPHLEELWKAGQKIFQDEQRTGAIDRIKKQAEAGNEPNVNGAASDIAKSFIQQGMKDRDEIVDAVHQELKRAVPQMTRREAMDAISGYGAFRPLTQNEINAQLRDLKGQLAALGKLEDLQDGQRLKKTGFARREPSAEEVRLKKEILGVQGMAKVKPRTFQPEPKTPITAEEIRIKILDSQIDKIEKQMAAGEVFSDAPKLKATSEEIRAREEELKQLKYRRQNVRDELQPKADPSTAEEAKTKQLDRQISELERQIKTGELFPKGKKVAEVDSPEIRARQKELDALKYERQNLRDTIQTQDVVPEEILEQHRMNQTKNRLNAQKIDLEERLRNQDYDAAPKRPAVALDKEGLKVQSEVNRLKQDLAIARELAADAKAPAFIKGLKHAAGVARGLALTGISTLGKLAGFTLGKYLTTPLTEAIGAAVRNIPGLRDVFDKANMEGSSSGFKGIGRFYSKTATEGMTEAYLALTKGKGRLSAELGNNSRTARPQHWYDFPVRVHKAEKSLVHTGDFYLRLSELEANADRAGMDLTDGLVQGALRKEAWEYSERAELQEANKAAQRISGLLDQSMKADPKSGEFENSKAVLATMMKVLVTKDILKTPLNHIWQTLESSPLGLGKASIDLFQAKSKGVKNISAEQANTIARLIKVGAAGTGFFVWGAVDYMVHKPEDRMFGGYYNPGEKRDAKDAKWGRVRIDGYNVLIPDPLTTSGQMGNTFMRVVMNKLQHHEDKSEAVLAGSAAALLSLAYSAPIINPIGQAALDSQSGHPEKVVWDMLAGQIPQFSADIAKYLDDGKSRTPKNLTQAVEMRVPGLRQNVPQSNAQKRRDIQQRQRK